MTNRDKVKEVAENLGEFAEKFRERELHGLEANMIDMKRKLEDALEESSDDREISSRGLG